MSVRYQLTLDEMLNLFGQNDKSGFSEQEIRTAEERLGVNLPQRYRHYLLTCGKDPLNFEFNQLFSPEEITTSYECIAEIITHPGFSTTYRQDDSDPYYRLSRIPQEEWHTITENYLLIWCENQGVWFAGYLLSDLQQKVDDPPVYITVNDDFIDFEPISGSTENFLIEALWPAIPGELHTLTAAEAHELLSADGIDPDRLAVQNPVISDKGIYFCSCYNEDSGRFYFYYRSDSKDTVWLTIADVFRKIDE